MEDGRRKAGTFEYWFDRSSRQQSRRRTCLVWHSASSLVRISPRPPLRVAASRARWSAAAPRAQGAGGAQRAGEGAQGAVWLAMEDGGRDLVAIKISQRGGDPRAGRESRILHTVGRHPNIVLFKSHLEEPMIPNP